MPYGNPSKCYASARAIEGLGMIIFIKGPLETVTAALGGPKAPISPHRTAALCEAQKGKWASSRTYGAICTARRRLGKARTFGALEALAALPTTFLWGTGFGSRAYPQLRAPAVGKISGSLLLSSKSWAPDRRALRAKWGCATACTLVPLSCSM